MPKHGASSSEELGEKIGWELKEPEVFEDLVCLEYLLVRCGGLCL